MVTTLQTAAILPSQGWYSCRPFMALPLVPHDISLTKVRVWRCNRLVKDDITAHAPRHYGSCPTALRGINQSLWMVNKNSVSNTYNLLNKMEI